jgi:hypothetical protein
MFENELMTSDIKLSEQQLFQFVGLCASRIKNYMSIFFCIRSFVREELSSVSSNLIIK